MRLAKFTIHTYGLAVAVLVFLLPASITVAQAQSQPSSEPDKVDAATVRSMLERITELDPFHSVAPVQFCRISTRKEPLHHFGAVAGRE